MSQDLTRKIICHLLEQYPNMGAIVLLKSMEEKLEEYIQTEWVQGDGKISNCIYSVKHTEHVLIECQWESIAKRIVDDHNLVLTMKETKAP